MAGLANSTCSPFQVIHKSSTDCILQRSSNSIIRIALSVVSSRMGSNKYVTVRSSLAGLTPNALWVTFELNDVVKVPRESLL